MRFSFSPLRLLFVREAITIQFAKYSRPIIDSDCAKHKKFKAGFLACLSAEFHLFIN